MSVRIALASPVPIPSEVIDLALGMLEAPDPEPATERTWGHGWSATGELPPELSDVHSARRALRPLAAHGVDATMEGTIDMRDVNITTAGNGAAAAIATDRGGGTITASGGTVVTTGTKSPAIYSTGSITVSGATLRSTASEVAVIEGKNSITVNDCVMESKTNFGVFIYQSMSGDASLGTGTFTMTRGSLTAEQGPLFYSTNTDAVIKLSGAALSCKSGVLLKAGADPNVRNKNANTNAITIDSTVSRNACVSTLGASVALRSGTFTGTAADLGMFLYLDMVG